MDLFRFYNLVKMMIGTVESVEMAGVQLDNLIIPNKNLTQLMSSIYGRIVAKKTHLLQLISSRAKDEYIMASEICAILVVDFVKSREKGEENPKPENYAAPVTLDSFAASKTRSKTPNKAIETTTKKVQVTEAVAEDPDQINFLMVKKGSTAAKRLNTKTTENKSPGPNNHFGMTMPAGALSTYKPAYTTPLSPSKLQPTSKNFNQRTGSPLREAPQNTIPAVKTNLLGGTKSRSPLRVIEETKNRLQPKPMWQGVLYTKMAETDRKAKSQPKRRTSPPREVANKQDEPYISALIKDVQENDPFMAVIDLWKDAIENDVFLLDDQEALEEAEKLKKELEEQKNPARVEKKHREMQFSKTFRGTDIERLQTPLPPMTENKVLV